jgi:hypothetical protein
VLMFDQSLSCCYSSIITKESGKYMFHQNLENS